MGKREDGLGKVLLPFDAAALVLGIGCTLWSGCRGWAAVPVLIGSVLGWFVVSLVVYLLGVWILSLTVDMNKAVTENHPACRRVVLHVEALLNRLGRVRIRMKGLEAIPEGRFLLVSNHRSNYDPIVTGWALRRWDMSFISKPENFKIPIAGPLIHQANYLPINREDPRRALDTIKAASSLLERDVVSVAVYPEGTRSHGKRMLPFHNGVFKIAQKANVPIVVVSVDGTEEVHNNLPWRHTDIELHVCQVIPAAEVRASTTAELGERVGATLRAELGLPEPETVC